MYFNGAGFHNLAVPETPQTPDVPNYYRIPHPSLFGKLGETTPQSRGLADHHVHSPGCIDRIVAGTIADLLEMASANKEFTLPMWTPRRYRSQGLYLALALYKAMGSPEMVLCDIPALIDLSLELVNIMKVSLLSTSFFCSIAIALAQECPPDIGTDPNEPPFGNPIPPVPEDIPTGCSELEILAGKEQSLPTMVPPIKADQAQARGTSENGKFGYRVGDPLVGNVTQILEGARGYPVQVSAQTD
jgi:hypothetical protein